MSFPYEHIKGFRRGYLNKWSIETIDRGGTFHVKGVLFKKGNIFPYQDAIGFSLKFVPKVKKSLKDIVERIESRGTCN